MRLNGVMAVMAVVCVATTLGAELKLGPLAKFLMVSGGAENNDGGGMAPADALIVYDEGEVAEALSAILPAGVPPHAFATNPAIDDFPSLGDPAVADDVDLHIGASGGFLIGRLTPSTLAPNTPTSDPTDPPGLPVSLDQIPIVSSAIATPEPATWAMMVFGIGAMGLALRRVRGRAATSKRLRGDEQRV